MNLTRLSVARPVLTTMLYLGLLLLGLVSFMNLPIDMMPEIEPPVISVITGYPGASASDIETAVTKEIENVLSGVSGMDEISSQSHEGYSLVVCEFDWDVDLNEASNDIRDLLDRVRQRLPDDIDEPMLVKFNTSNFPVVGVAVESRQNYYNLETLIDDQVIDVLKRLPGVGMVNAMGMRKRQINIILDKSRMAAYGLTPDMIAAVIEAENLDYPAGNVRYGERDYSLRVEGELADSELLNGIIISEHAGKPVYLRDVATVEDGFAEQTMFINVNRNPRSMFFIVQKQSGANTVDVVDRLRVKIDEINRTLPDDVKIRVAFDMSEFIIHAINNLYGTVLWGALFVGAIVLIFLRNWRASVIIMIALPLSLLVTMTVLYAMDWTINMMNLVAMVIALGMVIDNSVVVLENVMKYLERGVKPREAAIYGAGEVGSAIIASTLTTVVIFVPVLFMTGLVGIFFQQLGLCIITTIGVSLFIAITLSPVLCANWLRTKRKGPAPQWFVYSERILEWVESGYARLLHWALDHRKTIIVTALLFFATSMSLVPLVGTEFFPEEDAGEVRINYELAIGSRVEETMAVAQKLLDDVYRTVPEAHLVALIAGKMEDAAMTAISGWKQGTHVGMIIMRVGTLSTRERSTKEIASALRPLIDRHPEIAKYTMMTGNPMNQALMGGGKPIQLEIMGKDLDTTYGLAQQIQKIFQSVDGADDVEISLEFGQPELQVELDRDKAARMGISTRILATTLRSYFYGREAGKYREGGDEYDIFLRLRENQRRDWGNVREIALPAAAGGTVLLDEVATIREGFGPVSIERLNQQRVVRVSCNIGNRPMGDIVDDIKVKLESLQLPPGITTQWGGMVKEQTESFGKMFILLGLGIVLVYMVMASQFESLRDPFIIMFAVPFSCSGVIIAMLATGNTISLISFIGMIMLIGIVVNNAIVLIDYMNILRARGFATHAAIEEAGRHRLRPILITTLTTMCGLLPMALSSGEGSQFWSPLGFSVLGGLTVSTLVSLVLVPVLYSMMEEWGRKGQNA